MFRSRRAPAYCCLAGGLFVYDRIILIFLLETAWEIEIVKAIRKFHLGISILGLFDSLLRV